MDGIFNINKAANMTSHDVVARVRRLVQQKRVGHAGTLDPAATGVLPICLGQATRVAEYLSESGKAYRATIRFGCETDTYDADGRILREAPVTLEEEDILAVLPTFLGPQLQVPPLYSAIKRGGQPLYKLARAGGEVAPPPPRTVTIYSLEIVSYQKPDLVLDIDCSKGTYIRSLAFDLGRNLGPGAHLAGLIRTRSGPFTLGQSVHLEDLAQALADGSWENYLYAPDEALLDFDAAVVGERMEWRLRHGLDLIFPQPAQHNAGSLLRTYALDGRFLGILRWEEEHGRWKPHKVLTS
jgi:tRNA pseudouridine55 synthase